MSEVEKKSTDKKQKKQDKKQDEKKDKKKGKSPRSREETVAVSQKSLVTKQVDLNPTYHDEDHDHMYAISRENEYDYALVGFKASLTFSLIVT